MKRVFSLFSLLSLLPASFLFAEDENADEVERARLVVAPVIYTEDLARAQVLRDIARNLDLRSSEVIENPGFTSYLIDRLVNSRRFEVLDRSNLRQVVRELDFGESDYADPDEVARLGEMLNADFVVIPEIRYLRVTREERDVPYVETTRVRNEGTMGVTTRIIDVRTSSIQSSDISQYELTKRPPTRRHDPERYGIEFIEELYQKAADGIVFDILDSVYPIRIVEVREDRALVSRGEGFLEVGEVLTVFETGRAIIDPDTGSNLGFSEFEAGTVRISRLFPRFAEAEIIEQESPFEIGFTLRRNPGQLETAEEKGSPQLDW